MSAAVERFARRWWEGDLGWAGEALSAASLPLSWAWATAAATRGLRAPERVPGLAVISVGNLAVGGTGKTPVAAWISARLHATGIPSCVLVGGHADDEAELHRAWQPLVPVLSGSDRIANARRARAEGSRAAVLDDGFQHRRLERDLDLVVLAAEDAFPGRLLPRGPYREAPEALGRADAVVITRRVTSPRRARALVDAVERYAPEAARAAAHLEAGGFQGLGGDPGAPPDGDALAVCAVGRPRAFHESVKRLLRGQVELMDFADHHAYSMSDVERIQARARGRPVVITEKDAIKLRPFADVLRNAYALRDTLVWEWGEDRMARMIEDVVQGVVRP